MTRDEEFRHAISLTCVTDFVEHTEVPVDTLHLGALWSHAFGCIDVFTRYAECVSHSHKHFMLCSAATISADKAYHKLLWVSEDMSATMEEFFHASITRTMYWRCRFLPIVESAQMAAGLSSCGVGVIANNSNVASLAM